MQDGGHDRSPCPQVESDKRAAVLSGDAPLLQPVHSQYTKRPLTALKHRYPQRRLLEQYQRFTRLSTTTSDPDNDLPVLSSYIERGSPPSTTSPPTRFKGSLSQWTRSRRAWQTTCRRCVPMRGKSALVGIKRWTLRISLQSLESPWQVRFPPSLVNGRQRHTCRSERYAQHRQRSSIMRGEFEMYYDI